MSNHSAIGAAFGAWAQQNDPRIYPAERRAFEAGWNAGRLDGRAEYFGDGYEAGYRAAQQDAMPADAWLDRFDDLAMELYAATDDHHASLEALRAHARLRIEAEQNPASAPDSERDAARYRWLRAGNAEISISRGNGWESLCDEDLDRAIDAAIAAKEQK